MDRIRPNKYRHVIVVGLLMLVFGGGCAFRGLIYSNLEWLILYQVDKYLDLKPIQKTKLKIPIHETLLWFKAERLPALIIILKQSQILAQQGKLDLAYLNRQFATIADWRLEATQRLATPVGILLKNLDQDQNTYLSAKLAKEDAPLEKLLQYNDEDFAEEIEDYIQDKAKSLSFWVGKLEPHQIRMMSEELGYNRLMLSQQLLQKQRIREFWLTAIKKQELDSLIQIVRDSAQSDGGWRDPEYQVYRHITKERWQGFLRKLLASLEVKQWQHLDKTLTELIGEMETFGLKN